MSLAAIIGIQIGLIGLVAFGVAPRVRARWPRTAGLTLIVPSLMVIGGAALALTNLFGGATPDSSLVNPEPATVTSVDEGNRLYQANCAACHGVSGEGGGPLANTTPIQPPSLKAHLAQHTDGDLFYWISNGLPGGMPAWSSKLSETDRWNVINYLRAINAPGASIAPASSGPASAGPESVAPGVVAPSGPSGGAGGAASTAGIGTILGVAALPGAWSGVVAVLLSMRWRRRRGR
ncbi:MAG TPA: cytochrome c [Candidatus Limnocylindrales bacterium]|jgi:putative copper resistance protein D